MRPGRQHDPWQRLLTTRPSPLQRFLAAVGGLLALAGIVLLGAVFFGLFLAVFAVVGAIVAARVWWVRRQLRRRARSSGAASREGGTVIETEWRVIDRRQEKD